LTHGRRQPETAPTDADADAPSAGKRAKVDDQTV
jgi:hypothetical protein